MIKFGSFIFCASVFFIIGCSKPNALTNFNYDKFYGSSLQYTLKNDIVVDNNVIAMLSATYLNATNENSSNKTDEIFLVGVFVSKDDTNNISLSKEHKITLNNITPISMVALNKDNKMYSNMPLFNPWAKYYIVKFNKEKLNVEFLKNLTKKQKYTMLEYGELNLKLSINNKQSTTLTFQKEL